MVTNVENIKLLVSKHNEPLIIKHILNWNILKWDLNRWSEVLGDEKMTFRKGKNKKTKTPQWETTCEIVTGSFKDFVDFNDNSDEWIYFDYKYLHEHFLKINELHKDIQWSSLGFPHLNSKDATIWIGSKGAHTPCHVDTYGCNIIVQVYGRKRWILFPPEQNLPPTRIPYEQSTVYSKQNLFSPDIEQFKGVTKCKTIVLCPGEVLLLPHGWWHYVENLEKSISINVWIELPTDDEKRLEESLVQLFMSQIMKDLDEQTRVNLLNPNKENEFLHKLSLSDNLQLLNGCVKCCSETEENYMIDTTDILNMCNNIESIPYLTPLEFQELLRSQTSRFQEEENMKETTQNIEIEQIVDLINAFVEPNVINLVKKYIVKLKNKTSTLT